MEFENFSFKLSEIPTGVASSGFSCLDENPACIHLLSTYSKSYQYSLHSASRWSSVRIFYWFHVV